MRWHRSSDKFDDSLQQLTREPIKKTILTKKFPLWCKYFHISACTLTYWHINCNLVRFIWFYFCAIRCFLFGRFYFSLIFFFCIVLRFQCKYNEIQFNRFWRTIFIGWTRISIVSRREQVQRFDSNVLNNWQCTTNPEFSTLFIHLCTNAVDVCLCVSREQSTGFSDRFEM